MPCNSCSLKNQSNIHFLSFRFSCNEGYNITFLAFVANASKDFLDMHRPPIFFCFCEMKVTVYQNLLLKLSSYMFYSRSFLICGLLKFNNVAFCLHTEYIRYSIHVYSIDGPCDSESDLAFIYFLVN